MKNNYLILIAVIFFAIVGCKDDLLEKKPYGNLTEAQFWLTEQDAIDARNGLTSWTAREGIDGRGNMWLENCSDNLVTGRPKASADQVKNFQVTADSGLGWTDNWSKMYQIIGAANNILKHVPNMEISTEVKQNVVAEGHFWRGFAYLWLAPWYGDNDINGGIPIVTENTPFEELVGGTPRPNSILENYDMIIADMREAGDNLPWFSETLNGISGQDESGRPHKAAAWGFAARAALYAAQYDPSYYDVVLEMTKKIMNISGENARALYPNYDDLFEIENNWSSEYIFSMVGSASDGPKFAGMSFQKDGYGLYNTWGYFQPTLELYEAYETGDKRRDATILYPGEKIRFISKDITYGVSPKEISSSSNLTFNKWMAPFREKEYIGTITSSNGNNQSTRLSLPLLRYADILLMRAEALIWTKGEGNAEAVQLLNDIRQRAGLPRNSNGTKPQLKNERRCELAFEFLPSRHLDLVRWGDAQTEYAKPLHGVTIEYRIDINGDETNEIIGFGKKEIFPGRNFNPSVHHVFPIPAADVASNPNLIQNVGY